MNNRMYQLILILLLVIVLVSVYFQFTTFGTDQYWIFVVILVVIWIASRVLRKKQSNL